MNIAIVDDMRSDRLRLEQVLKQYAALNDFELNIDHYSGGEAFLKSYQPFQYTIIFLDIYMDGITGIETAKTIRKTDDEAVLVFLTTSEEHRSDAFSVFASNYISKPPSKEEIFRTLDHILHCQTKKDNYFYFTYDRHEYCLRYADIASIETDGNYIVLRDRKGKSYRTRMTFSNAENQMDERFLVLMKGILVNMDYIVQIREALCIMQDGGSFPINVKKKREIKQKWLNYKFTSIRNETNRMGVKME